MIPNPSLDCSYAVLNFWPNLSLVVLIMKIVLMKKKRVIQDHLDELNRCHISDFLNGLKPYFIFGYFIVNFRLLR